MKNEGVPVPDAMKKEGVPVQDENDSLEALLRHTTGENQHKTDWTTAWSVRYPVLKTYQSEVDIPRYAAELRRMLTRLQSEHGYTGQDAMLVLKDILYHEYTDHKTDPKA